VSPLEKQMSLAAFIDDLLTQVPELSVLHRQHIEAHQGLVPAVFMAEVTRLVMGLMTDQVGAEPLTRLLASMEQALQSRDAGVRELVEASFVESLSARTAAPPHRPNAGSRTTTSSRDPESVSPTLTPAPAAPARSPRPRTPPPAAAS
jgi:hypothetical protein